VLSSNRDDNLILEYKPVQMRDGLLSFGQPTHTKVISRINGAGFMNGIKLGG
jgi:hypothetical protein